MKCTNKLELVEINKLVPYVNNTRTHSDEQIKQIRKSIREFGFINPVLVDKEYNVIAGHGRITAAKEEGITVVPCVPVEHLSEAQKKAYMIADNKLALNAEWDLELLKIEIDELKSLDFDIELTGFDMYELADLDSGTTEFEDDNYDTPCPVDPVSKRGDIYMLGNHRLMCGDCTYIKDVKALMEKDKASLVWTDPPWNVDYGNSDNPKWKTGIDRQILNDKMDSEEFGEFLLTAFSNMSEVIYLGAMVYVVMSAQEWGNIMNSMKDAGYHWSSTIIWNKNKLVLSRKDYHTKYEPIWYGWQGDNARLCPLTDRHQSDVWDIDRPNESPEHPTMKPVELAGRSIQNSSRSGDIVIDFFGGSGTTMIACEQLNRQCRMMELDPKYVDVIIDRWENYTGKKAVKQNG